MYGSTSEEYGYYIRTHTLISLLLASTLAFILGFSTWIISREQLQPIPGHALTTFITTASAFLFYRYFNRKAIRRYRELQKPFPESWRQILNDQVEYYRALNEIDKNRFEQRLRIFLLEHRIVGIGWEVDEQIRLLIGSGAVIPTLGLRRWEYQGLGTIFVYLDAFDTEYRVGKGAPLAGQVTSSRNFRALAFSRAHIIRSFLLPPDGRNVVIHEFVHVIDSVDGAIDGCLEISWNPSDCKKWSQIVVAEQRRIANGRTLIDRYATASQIEFLAVLSEYFFELPDLLAREHPEVFELLKKGFHQNPQLILSRSSRPLRAAELIKFRDEYWNSIETRNSDNLSITDQATRT